MIVCTGTKLNGAELEVAFISKLNRDSSSSSLVEGTGSFSSPSYYAMDSLLFATFT